MIKLNQRFYECTEQKSREGIIEVVIDVLKVIATGDRCAVLVDVQRGPMKDEYVKKNARLLVGVDYDNLCAGVGKYKDYDSCVDFCVYTLKAPADGLTIYDELPEGGEYTIRRIVDAEKHYVFKTSDGDIESDFMYESQARAYARTLSDNGYIVYKWEVSEK